MIKQNITVLNYAWIDNKISSAMVMKGSCDPLNNFSIIDILSEKNDVTCCHFYLPYFVDVIPYTNQRV